MVNVILMDGFDYLSSSFSGWTVSPSRFSPGRFGGQAAAGGGAISWRPLAAPLAGGVGSMNAAVQSTALTSTIRAPIFYLLENPGLGATNANTHLIVQFNGDGTFSVCRGGTADTNTLGTSAAVIPADLTYHWLDFEYTIHPSAGSVKLTLDGSVILNVTGVNTRGGTGATTSVGAIGLMSDSRRIVDDLYMTDGASLGERRIATLQPSADTATKQWTPNSGTANFSRVNEAVNDGDTSYVATGTAGNKDLYDLANLSFTPTAIDAVQIGMIARKDDAATRTCRVNLKSGSTTVNGTTLGLASTYVMQRDILQTDPNTSAAWTASGVNAAQIGVECVA